MKNRESYQEIEENLNITSKLCASLIIDKKNCNDLIEFQRQEIDSLKEKIKGFVAMNNYLKQEIKSQVNVTIEEILDSYAYNFKN